MVIADTTGRNPAAIKTGTSASSCRFLGRFLRWIVIVGIGAFFYNQYRKGEPLIPGLHVTQLTRPQLIEGAKDRTGSGWVDRAIGRDSTNQGTPTAVKKQIPLKEMPRLEGILYTKSNPVAIINGERLTQGESFHCALSRGTIAVTLAEIHPGSVLIQAPDYLPVTLNMGGVGNMP